METQTAAPAAAEYQIGDRITWPRTDGPGEDYEAEIRAFSGNFLVTPIGRVHRDMPGLRKGTLNDVLHDATWHKEPAAGTKPPPLRELRPLPVTAIRPFALQTRKEFAPEDLAELAESIREHGLLEPIGVRRCHTGGTPWELIYGERRWRASQQAGLAEIPCLCFSDLPDREAMAIHVEENERRSQLNPIERAEAFAKLRELGMSQTELGERLDVKQSTVSRVLNLVKLPDPVKELLRAGKLSASHGEELLKWAGRPELCIFMAEQAAENGDPVRVLQEKLPYAEVLRSRRKIRECGYNTAFDWRALQKDPAHAADFVEGRYGNWYCLDTKLFDRLQKEAKGADEAKVAAAVAQVEHDGKELVDLRSKPYGSYKVNNWEKPDVPGCSRECPCAQYGREGKDTPFRICTDPARLERLRTARRDAERAVKKAYLERLLDQVGAELREQAEIGSRGLAYLGQVSLAHSRPELLQAAGDMAGLDVAALLPLPGMQVDWRAGSALPPAELFRLLLALAAVREGQTRLQWGEYSGPEPRELEWLLGVTPEAEPPRGEPEPDELDPSLCARCHRPLPEPEPGGVELPNGVVRCPEGTLLTPNGASYCAACAPGIEVCLKCGCTDEAACEGGCTWVADDLCSACVPAGEGDAAEGLPRQCQRCGDDVAPGQPLYTGKEGYVCESCKRDARLAAAVVEAGGAS
jgi:ParB/RepB/Spo0J family partition protein